MKLFKPWTWFNSEERALKLEFLKLSLEKLQRELIGERQKDKDTWEQKQLNKKPYVSLRLIDTTVTIVLHGGEVLSKDDVDRLFYDSVKSCKTEEELMQLFFHTFDVDNIVVETTEEKRQMADNIEILRHNPDFVISGTDVFFKNIPLKMPAFIAGSFIEICEKRMISEDVEELKDLIEKYEALKMFWFWTALNPIAASRQDLLSFVRREDIKITKNGLLEMYRNVVKVGKKDKTLTENISHFYYKVKKNRKAPSNYRLVKISENEYCIEKTDNTSPKGALVGNLETLYLNLPEMQENRYTDAHTRSKDIRIGQVYKEDEDKIDLDNKRDCSNGLTCSPVA